MKPGLRALRIATGADSTAKKSNTHQILVSLAPDESKYQVLDGAAQLRLEAVDQRLRVLSRASHNRGNTGHADDDGGG